MWYQLTDEDIRLTKRALEYYRQHRYTSTINNTILNSEEKQAIKDEYLFTFPDINRKLSKPLEKMDATT